MNVSKLEMEKAREIHAKAIVINALESSHAERGEFNEKYASTLKDAGVTVSNVTVPYPIEVFLRDAINSVALWYSTLNKIGQDKCVLATSADDIRKAKRDGKVAIIFGTQNVKHIEDDTQMLGVFHKLGVRICQLTYQTRNSVGNGCGERADSGLSMFGVRVVEELNRIGSVISLSHVGPKTSMDAIETSKDPVIFSHSNAHALCDNIRNISDEHIKATAEKGGVIGINILNQCLNTKKATDAVGLEDYLNHIDYIVKLVGVKHVGLGLDFRDYLFSKEEVERFKRLYPELVPKGLKEGVHGSKSWNPWFDSMLKTPVITEGLVSRGYSDSDIVKILGGNFLGLFERVWKD